jgi:hypothetical protein
MTLVELDSVTTRWARQEPPPAPHFLKTRRYYFLTELRFFFYILYCLGNVQKILVPGTAFKYICVAVGGGTAAKVRRIGEYSSEIP